MHANQFVVTAKPYPLVSHKAWELSDKKSILKLDWNEAAIAPSPRVVQSVASFLQEGMLNWYPDVHNMQLQSALSEYCGIPDSHLQYYPSSDALHESILRAFLNPGDRLCIVAPTYDNFRASAEVCGINVDYYYTAFGDEFDTSAFAKHLSESEPDMVYICNPNNPTGTQFSVSALHSIVAQHPEQLFVVDEAYYEFSNVTLMDSVLTLENLVITRSFSKAFAMASFRIGYVASCPENIQLLSKVRNSKNISSIAQVAAIAALSDQEYMREYVKTVGLAKKWFYEFLISDLPTVLTPFLGGGNFIMFRVNHGSSSELIRHLANNMIFLRDYGHVAGLQNHVRVTIGTTQQMQIVGKNIRQYFDGIG